MRPLTTFLALALTCTGAFAQESWRLPLAEKERAIEANIRLRHNILGLYPSMVEIPADGGAIDNTTTNPFADIQHAVCWTANYLAGASYRYAVLKNSGAPAADAEEARKRADEIFEAVYRCQLVTGRRGLQARGYFLGHGATYAEHPGASKLPFWRQGQLDGQDFRWVGDPSHHNYSDSIHGLGQYYDLAAEGEQKARCREAIDALVSYWVDNDLLIDKYDRSLRPVRILGFTDGKTLNTRIMMAIAGARVAYHATGKEKFKAAHDALIDQYGVRGLKEFDPGKGFDDAEHVFCHLDNLFRIEDDPELLAAYRVVADGLWANHKNDGQSLFTYIYYAIAPDAPGKDEALEQAHRALFTWPTDMTIKPRMNSLNPDMKPPYPVYAAAWDNEYIWKGNLLKADGWISRLVLDVAVPADDPSVIFAVGQAGGLYESRDAAATVSGWRPIDKDLPGAAIAVDAGPSVRMVYAACDTGFYFSASGGRDWRKMDVPYEGRPMDILIDPNEPFVLYAVTDRGVWRNIDFGEKFLGRKWESLTGALPGSDRGAFHVALSAGKTGRIYAVLEEHLFTRSLENAEWHDAGRVGFPESTRNYPWFVTDPNDPDHAITGLWTQEVAGQTVTLLRHSHDGGMTWSPTLEDIYTKYAEGGVAALMPLMIMGRIGKPVIAPGQPDRMLIAAEERGVLLTQDGGKGWAPVKEGFSIPLVHLVFAPGGTDRLFAATPGGLFVSEDGGKAWKDANLWLQFEKNTRRELGGASFIDAYWRARYYGFVDETTANAPYEGTP